MPRQNRRPRSRIRSYDLEPTAEQIEKLNRLIEAGPFEVHVARTFPLDQAADAHRELDKHYLENWACGRSKTNGPVPCSGSASRLP